MVYSWEYLHKIQIQQYYEVPLTDWKVQSLWIESLIAQIQKCCTLLGSILEIGSLWWYSWFQSICPRNCIKINTSRSPERGQLGCIMEAWCRCNSMHVIYISNLRFSPVVDKIPAIRNQLVSHTTEYFNQFKIQEPNEYNLPILQELKSLISSLLSRCKQFVCSHFHIFKILYEARAIVLLLKNRTLVISYMLVVLKQIESNFICRF